MTRTIHTLLAGAALAAAGAVALGAGLVPARAEEGIAIPAPALDEAPHGGTETAVIAGGCF